MPIDGVAVIITATPVKHPDGSIELCPPGMTGACPGIVLEGDIDPGRISSEDNPTVVQVGGTYDGRALYSAAEPVAVEYPPNEQIVFASLCPDLQGTPLVDPDVELEQGVASYAQAQPDYAAWWWDREAAVLTVWFKGDDISAHQAAIAKVAGDEPVCVAGGARFSEAELLEASELLNDFRDSRGLALATFGYGVGGLSNRIDVPLEEIDSETRAALTELVGDRVVPYPYIEMTDASLADLPEPIPAVEGDVDILTSRVRSGGGMDALSTFELRYDAELNCVYSPGFAEGGRDRSVLVWPFGYSATSDPMTVYDYDGNPVASEGDAIELAGGGVDIEFIEGNTCGADGAWIVNR